MADWCFSPEYRLYIRTQGKTWSIKTMQSAQCLLQTGQGVNQASLVLADPDGFIAKTVAPKAMSLIQLWTRNRFGQGGVVWTGYVDEVHRAFDPDQGSGITLTCTGPVKLFEITRQSPGDVAGLAIAYARNVAASSVVKFAARACGYPSGLLNIHPVADSGSGLQQLGIGPLTQPDQQPWSAVVSSLQANSGLEFFFGARGELFWRQLNFLDPWFPARSNRPRTMRPRVISQDDVLHADFAESDAGVVTDVQVRWAGGLGFVQSAANWPEFGKESSAHKNMVAHLRTRRLVVYAPWIYNKPAAQYLAQVLYDQYSAGVAQASLTIPADPLIEVGSLVDVPALGTGGTTRYYVSSCTYQLTWGGAWVMTLGLAYGRSPNESFPYTGTVAFPALSAKMKPGGPRPAAIASWNSGNPYYDDTPYTIVAQSSLHKDQAAVPSSVYPVGSVIYIYSKPHSAGKLVGPAALGEYTVVAPANAAQADTTIALQSTKNSIGYVTVKHIGPAIAPEVGAGADGGTITAPTQFTGLGTGYTPTARLAPVRVPANGSLAQRAYALALEFDGGKYTYGASGTVYDGSHRTFDCAGLVVWCYAQCGYTWGDRVHANADGSIQYILNAAQIFSWFAGIHGGAAISVDQAQPGDLLFCGPSANWAGIGHIAFCSKPGGFASGQCFGANNSEDGIGSFAIAGYHDGEGDPYAFAIDTSGVTISGA